MAPRGGGGGGRHGGGSSGGSQGSGSGTSQPNYWTVKSALPGSHFHDGLVLATLVILCTCFVALVGAFIWSFRIKTYGNPSRQIFKLPRLGIAFLLTIIGLALRIADIFLHELRVVVTGYYVILYIFLLFFTLASVISLIFVIIVVAINHFYRMKTRQQGKSLFWIHYAIILVMIAVLVVTVYFYVKYEIAIVDRTNSILSNQHSYGKTLTVFRALTLFVAIDIIVISALILRKNKKLVSSSKESTFLTILVAAPFLLSAIVEVALTVKYVLVESNKPIPRGVPVIQAILVELPTVVAFVGLVMIGTRRERSGQSSGAAYDGTEQYSKGPTVVQDYKGSYTPA